MHFSKTYTELLHTLPPELRNNAIEYRKLKKLINQVVRELTVLGLSPEVLHQILLESKPLSDLKGKGREVDGRQAPASPWVPVATSEDAIAGFPRVVYEINTDSDKLEPRLRLLVNTPLSLPTVSADGDGDGAAAKNYENRGGDQDEGATGSLLPNLSYLEHENDDATPPYQEAKYAAQKGTDPRAQAEDHLRNGSAPGTRADMDVPNREEGFGSESRQSESIIPPSVPFARSSSPSSSAPTLPSSHTLQQEVIIPLPSDTAFFQLLMEALQTLSTQLGAVSDEFLENLHELSRLIASTARPLSATSHSFHGHSLGTNPALVRVPAARTVVPLIGGGGKSDLYQWREIFQIYIDLEVFEHHGERMRGERSVEDSERRLETFKQRLEDRGYLGGRALRLKESREAMAKFVQLNVFILDLKKFQFATTEATRKILKKHAKRTALPVPHSVLAMQSSQHDPSSAMMLMNRPGTSLAQMLVQAVGETILPIVPHIDDYACVICTSIAFKPIRLRCGHLFCVRCLVKMQKQGKGNCPMCRAPTVIQADRSNVDWALLNFMKDWFPIEAREKLQQSEREAAEEQMKELGFKPDGPTCLLM